MIFMFLDEKDIYRLQVGKVIYYVLGLDRRAFISLQELLKILFDEEGMVCAVCVIYVCLAPYLEG